MIAEGAEDNTRVTQMRRWRREMGMRSVQCWGREVMVLGAADMGCVCMFGWGEGGDCRPSSAASAAPKHMGRRRHRTPTHTVRANTRGEDQHRAENSAPFQTRAPIDPRVHVWSCRRVALHVWLGVHAPAKPVCGRHVVGAVVL